MDVLRGIASRRWWKVVCVLFAAAAVALGFVPLLSTIGFEFAGAFSVPAALAAGCAGVAAVRRERAGGASGASPAHPLVLWAGVLPAALLPLAAPLLIGFAHGLHERNCTPSMTALFWLLMPVSSAGFASALGIVIARVVRGHRRAGWLFAGVVAASLAWWVVGLLRGPAMYGGNHFFGWFAGGIYEEVMSIDRGLWYLRLLSLLLAILLLLASAAWGDRHATTRPPRDVFAIRWEVAALLFFLVAFGTARWFAESFRLGVTGADIRRGLGGHLATEHFDIYYQEGAMTPRRLALLAEDHEFRLAVVSEYLGVKPSRRIKSYFFPSAGSKRRWTGSGEVQVANPWKREIYIDDTGHPLAVLEHELVHVVSAEFGIPVFGYATRGFSLSPGLIEGIAVAASWHDTGRGTPHEQSAAMMKEGLLPKPEHFLGLGFWGDRQARSYTAAGSFVRWLIETHGIESFRDAYARGNLEGVYRSTLPALAAAWHDYLETIPVAPASAAAARERFTQPSLFEQTCARELARLRDEANGALYAGRHDEARILIAKWRAIDDRTEPLVAQAELERRSGNLDEARRIAASLVEREIPGSPGMWRARNALADLAFESGDLAAAGAGYAEILEARVPPALERETWMTGAAVVFAGSERLSERAVAGAVRDWLIPPPTGVSIVPLVATTTAATIDGSPSASFVGSYLIGRSLLHTSGDPRGALPWLDAAARNVEIVDRTAVHAELLAMRADALTRLGELDEAAKAWAALAAVPGAGGDVLDRARDGAARVAWKQRVVARP